MILQKPVLASIGDTMLMTFKKAETAVHGYLIPTPVRMCKVIATKGLGQCVTPCFINLSSNRIHFTSRLFKRSLAIEDIARKKRNKAFLTSSTNVLGKVMITSKDGLICFY